MEPRALALLALVVGVPLAGCLSDKSAIANDAAPLLDAGALAGCDGPVLGSRIRAREIDVAADPADRSRLAAAMMVSIPSTRAAPPNDPAVWVAVARSADGGETWRSADLSGWPGDPGIASSPFAGSAIVGDPIVRFLPDGTLLVVGLAIRGGAWIDVFAARFPGDAMAPSEVSILSRGGYGEADLNMVPGPYQLFYNDKPEVGVDPATGAIYVAWMWRTNHPDRGSVSVPVVMLSLDGGRTWQGPVELVEALGAGLTSDGLHVGASPFVTGDGMAHVMWWDQPGNAFRQVDAPSGTLDFGAASNAQEVAGSFGGAGALIALSVPHVAVGPGPGGLGQRTYVTWTEQDEGRGFDVFLIHSDDGATTWSDRVRVNQDDSPGHQVLPAVAIGPGGHVAVSYMDTRNDTGGGEFEAYVAVSRDGATFEEARMSSVASVPARMQDPIQPIGDYYGIAYGARGPVALWEDGREGTTDVPYGTAYRCIVPLGAPPAG
ncbi:MAG: sialidase family protein [Thermoplasmatota archaeon]